MVSGTPLPPKKAGGRGGAVTSRVRLTRSILFRFINGMGVGTASAITPLYISENAPRAIRGALTGLYQLFIVTGVMLAFW